jgi:hypothetical protein
MTHGNTTYMRHFFKAMRISSRLMAGSAYCFVHAFIPVVFEDKASKIVKKLNDEFED